METNYDLDKLKALVHSQNPADAELALAIGDSLGLPIRDYYNEWMTVFRFWTSDEDRTGSDLRPYKDTSLGAFIAALKEKKGIYLHRLDIKKICPESRLLADWVERFEIRYASVSRFPEGLGVFVNMKELNVDSGDLKEVRACWGFFSSVYRAFSRFCCIFSVI